MEIRRGTCLYLNGGDTFVVTHFGKSDDGVDCANLAKLDPNSTRTIAEPLLLADGTEFVY